MKKYAIIIFLLLSTLALSSQPKQEPSCRMAHHTGGS